MPLPTDDVKEYARFEQAMCVEAVKFGPYASRLTWLKVEAPSAFKTPFSELCMRLMGSSMVGAPLDEAQIKYNT